MTVQEIADDCGISVGSCDAILTDDLHIKLVCMKSVPRVPTDDQCEQCQTIAHDLFERSCEDVQFLKNTVTGDESWVCGYDPETKQQFEKLVHLVGFIIRISEMYTFLLVVSLTSTAFFVFYCLLICVHILLW